MNNVKAALFGFLVSRAGSILTPIFSILVALAFAWLAGLHPIVAEHLKEIDPGVVVGGLVALALAVINAWTNAKLTFGAKVTQKALNALLPDHKVLKEDGVIGGMTLKALGSVAKLPVDTARIQVKNSMNGKVGLFFGWILLIAVGLFALGGCSTLEGYKATGTVVHEASGVSVTVGYRK